MYGDGGMTNEANWDLGEYNGGRKYMVIGGSHEKTNTCMGRENLYDNFLNPLFTVYVNWAFAW